MLKKIMFKELIEIKLLFFYTTLTLIKVCQRLKNNTKYMNSEAIKVT